MQFFGDMPYNTYLLLTECGENEDDRPMSL
jgi:hypothetical protein